MTRPIPDGPGGPHVTAADPDDPAARAQSDRARAFAADVVGSGHPFILIYMDDDGACGAVTHAAATGREVLEFLITARALVDHQISLAVDVLTSPDA